MALQSNSSDERETCYKRRTGKQKRQLHIFRIIFCYLLLKIGFPQFYAIAEICRFYLVCGQSVWCLSVFFMTGIQQLAFEILLQFMVVKCSATEETKGRHFKSCTRKPLNSTNHFLFWLLEAPFEGHHCCKVHVTTAFFHVQFEFKCQKFHCINFP